MYSVVHFRIVSSAGEPTIVAQEKPLSEGPAKTRMGRKKIQISRIGDERNRQVSSIITPNTTNEVSRWIMGTVQHSLVPYQTILHYSLSRAGHN